MDIYQSSFNKYLKMLAPGTFFRQGIENILQARTGGLIVVGDSPQLMDIISGGLHINCELTAARLYELAKMDGAIITDCEAANILVANAQLDPNPNLPSKETGIRHRTAERVARQTGHLVIAISQRRSVVTLYQDNIDFRMRSISSILVKANQALQTLEKYKNVFMRELQRLGGLEFENLVTVRDVCEALKRCIKVLVIAQEIENYIIELGTEGRLVKMQLDEMIVNIREEALLIIKDYKIYMDKSSEEILELLLSSYSDEISDLILIAKILGCGHTIGHLDQPLMPKGFRVLNRIPRLPSNIIENLVKRFSNLSNIKCASIEELDEVEGIGEVRAKSIINGFTRMQEQLLLDFMV